MDFSSPISPPHAPHLDLHQRVWTLSRYTDVQAALREPSLQQASPKGKITYVAGAANHSQLRAETQTELDILNSALMCDQMVRDATRLMNQSAHGRPVDLLREVIQPWSTTVMLSLCMADRGLPDPALKNQLTSIANRLYFKREMNPAWWMRRIFGQSRSNSWSNWQQKRAEAHLNRLLANGQLKIGKSTLIGVTQTMPSFLARAWLDLLMHPEQMAKLRNDPNLMPCAVEELLRHAGVVHSLHRLATEDVVLGDAAIVRGDRIVLKMESANRDPLKFDAPDRLDITRRPAGNLGFGTGPHACVAAAVIRTVLGFITPIFLAANPTLEADAPIVWSGDSSVRWPLHFSVGLNSQAVETEVRASAAVSQSE
jgi:cytochrome P450